MLEFLSFCLGNSSFHVSFLNFAIAAIEDIQFFMLIHVTEHLTKGLSDYRATERLLSIGYSHDCLQQSPRDFESSTEWTSTEN